MDHTGKEFDAARYVAKDLEKKLASAKLNGIILSETALQVAVLLPYLRHLEATARPTAPAATAEAWVSVLERLPEAMSGTHCPEFFSHDVLLWSNEHRAPAVGYYDYRPSYELFQVYDIDDYPTPTHWQPITPPTT